MSWSTVKSASWGAASLAAAALLAGPAFADGMPTRSKVAAPEARPCTTAGNVGITSDYVFRGISQSNEETAIQGGVDITCGRFYVGFWGSSVSDFANPDGIELDIFAGFRTTIGRLTLDLGVIYYTYPGVVSDIANYVEVKVGASAEVWRGGTVGATVFYSPEYTYEWGGVTTYEVSYSQALPKVGIFSPTFSALYGYSAFHEFSFASYAYWNAGLSLGFLDKWSLDLRYWDSDNPGFFAPVNISDERFVATLKYTF